MASRCDQHMQSLLINHGVQQSAWVGLVVGILSNHLLIVQYGTHCLRTDAALEHALERKGQKNQIHTSRLDRGFSGLGGFVGRGGGRRQFAQSAFVFVGEDFDELGSGLRPVVEQCTGAFGASPTVVVFE